MTDPITLTFPWTEQMLVEGASTVQVDHRPSLTDLVFDWRLILLSVLAIVAGAGSLIYFGPAEAAQTIWLFGFGVGAVIGVGFLMIAIDINAAGVRRAEVQSRNDAGLQVVELGPNGVQAQLGPWRQDVPWPAVYEVLEAKTGVILLFSAAAFLHLPDSALPSGMSREDLRRQIKAWRGA